MEFDVMITNHGKQRIKERTGVGKSERKMQRLAGIAFERGIQHKDVKGKMKRYLDGVYLAYKKADNIRIYGGKIWLFHGLQLITVMTLPSEYQLHLDMYLKNKEEEEEEIDGSDDEVGAEGSA